MNHRDTRYNSENADVALSIETTIKSSISWIGWVGWQAAKWLTKNRTCQIKQ